MNGNQPPYTQEDFAHSPFVAFYEVTRACDLVCKHCRACAQSQQHPYELKTEQSKALIEQFASFPKPPLLVFTGGDPMKRKDIFDLVRHAVACGLTTAMTPSATPLMTAYAVDELRSAGISRLAMSLDAVDMPSHDSFRGVSGSYRRTMEIMSVAKAVGLPTQVNTTITRRNYYQIDAMAEMLAKIGISLWSVFFLIPVGRGLMEERIQPEQYEEVFEALWRNAQIQPFGIKTTEAHHYRRYVLQRQGNPQADKSNRNGHPGDHGQPSNGHGHPGGMPAAMDRHPAAAPHSSNGNGRPGIDGGLSTPLPGRIQRAPLGVNDGKGVMFVSHTGTVYPSGFMPIRCGKFPEESIVDVYQNSSVFQDLRNPDLLKGKCGDCEFRSICGGSRARAYAISRDHLAAEPDCVYVPLSRRVAEPCLV